LPYRLCRVRLQKDGGSLPPPDSDCGTDSDRQPGNEYAARLLSTRSGNVYTGSAIAGDDSHSSERAGQASELEALVSNFLENHTYEREHARAALVNREGITRIEDEVRRTVPSPVIVIVTNARVIFVTPDDELGLEEGLLDYGDLTEIGVDAGRPNLVKLTTKEGIIWRCILPDADPAVVAAVKNHLRWIGALRSRTVELEADIEETADTIRGYADEMDWEAARAAYERERNRLDRLIADCNVTDTVANPVIAPELTDIARTLEEAHVRMYIEQARSKLELARHLVEREEYESAADALEETRDIYQAARGQSEAVRRGDAFQFGRQRELDEDLQRLDWEIESVAAEPLRQANDATVRAKETEDPATTIEHREIALDRYNRVLELDWLDIDPGVEGDPEEIRQHRTETIKRLVSLHAEIARERWNQAVYRQRASDVGASLERVNTAVTHIERAHELADELDRGQATLAAELDWMPEAVDEDRGPTRGRQSIRRQSTDWTVSDDTATVADEETETDADETDDTPAPEDGVPTLDDEIPTLDGDDSGTEETKAPAQADETTDDDPPEESALSLSEGDESATTRESSADERTASGSETDRQTPNQQESGTDDDPETDQGERPESEDRSTADAAGEPPARVSEAPTAPTSGSEVVPDGDTSPAELAGELLDTEGDQSLTWLDREPTAPEAQDAPSLPSVRDLTEMDTHHEITFDIEDLSVASEETGDSESAVPDATGAGVEPE
jgi:hypothetical protein